MGSLMKSPRVRLPLSIVTVLICVFALVALLYTERISSPSSSSIFRFKSCSKQGTTRDEETMVDAPVKTEVDDRFEFDPNECSVAHGKWVFNSSLKPLYTDRTCPYIDRQFACAKNGRPDSDYRHWVWQPDDCILPRFNPRVALQKLRGKRLMFVGDSLHRNQWESFLCLVEFVVPKEQKSMRLGKSHSVFQLKGARNQADALVEKTIVAGFDGMLKEDASIINKISCELTCKCSGGDDAHSTAMTIFNNLSNYSWDAKVVISLAAFAANYGEFWLMAQLSTTNPLAKSVSVLKQLSSIRAHASSLKSRVDPINNLLHNAILKVIDCIFQFKELPPQYISHERPPAPLATAMAHFPAAAYWTIRSIVVCSTQTTSLSGMSNEQIKPTEALELSSLAEKLVNIQVHLSSLLQDCQAHIDENKRYKGFCHLFAMVDIEDNMTILKELISLKDDKLQKPLQGGSSDSTKKRVGIEEVLKRKTVVLLISDLDHIAEEELFALTRTYNEAKTKSDLQYEIVWIPVVDRSTDEEESRKKFEKLQAKMSWFTVANPWLLDPAFIRYMKEEWHFSKKLILVALDPQGKVVCNNALHMFMVWGNVAYPFTVAKEESLWKEETWKLELLVDGNCPAISDWISQGKHICLYGGADLEWVRNFTAAAKDFAKTAGITLEMVYVGKSKANERVKKITSTIEAEKLSHCLPNPTYISYFWTRLECIWYSRTQHGKTAENDWILQEVSAMLSFDGSEQGWAVISNGSTEMVRANGGTILKIFKEVKLSAEETKQKGFVLVLNENIEKSRQLHHCNKLLLPWTSTGIPEKLLCADCARPMEKYFMYRCCTD